MNLNFLKNYFCLSLLMVSCLNAKVADWQKEVEKINTELQYKFIYQQTDILDTVQYFNLNKTLTEFYQTDSIRINCILTDTFAPFVNEMEFAKYMIGLNSESYAYLVFIVVFVKDRKVVIRTTENAKAIYSDSACRVLLDSSIIPNLKQYKYYEALMLATENLKSM